MFRQDSKNAGAIETYSADGTLLNESPVTGPPATVRQSELGIKKLRSSKLASSSVDHQRVDELSQKQIHAHQEYVDAVLDDGRNIRLNLSRPELTISDVAGPVATTHLIDREVLDRYSSIVQSSDPHVFYPELYSPILSPDGRLFALVGNTKLADGAIAVQIEPETAAINLVLRFMLPTAARAKNADNMEGYLVPGSIAMSQNCVFVLDKGSGILALYSGQF